MLCKPCTSVALLDQMFKAGNTPFEKFHSDIKKKLISWSSITIDLISRLCSFYSSSLYYIGLCETHSEFLLYSSFDMYL